MWEISHLMPFLPTAHGLYQTDQNPIDGAPSIMTGGSSWWGFGGDGTHFELEVFSEGGWIGRNYTGTISPNKWYHVAASYDGGPTAAAIKLFINGKRVDDTDIGDGTFTSIILTAAPLHIGADADAVGTYPEKIDDVHIYNRALSATEIKQLYNSSANTVGHSNAIISNGLVGYWTFDGGSIDWHTNTVSDMSGQGNTGSLISMSTTTSPVPGKIGQALSFNGTTQRIHVGYDPSLEISTGTISAWIKTTNAGLSDAAGIIVKQYAYGMYLSNNNLMVYDFGSAQDHNCATGLNDNKWHLVTAAFYGGTVNGMRCYVDGNLVAVNTISIVNQDADLIIGEGDTGAQYFTGQIDDARVYNRALSATEVKQLYNAGR
jgi:hypothetical protein